MQMKFPEFSRNKKFSMQPEIVTLDNNAPNSVFDIIIGVDALRKVGVILNFAQETITIDNREITMRPLGACSSIKMRKHVLKRENRSTLQSQLQFPKVQPDLVAVTETTDMTMGILAATYEKVDLPKIIQENCDHLSAVQKAKLLKG